MNYISTGTFDSIDLASIVADVTGLIQDSSTSTSLTFFSTGTRSVDANTGTVSYGDTAVPCTGFLGPLSWKQRQHPGAQEADVQVLLSVSDLAVIPKNGTRFLANSINYSVYQADSGPLATHYVVLAHRAD